jgi:type IV secretory pathway VirB9-like protein
MLALAASLALAPSMVCADDSARFVSFKYRENEQVTLACSAAELCELSFAKGEALADFFVADPVRWRIQPTFSAGASARPELIAQAQAPGLRTNMIVFSRAGRTYRILLESVADPRPLYARFIYPDPAPVRYASPQPKPRPAAPLTLPQIVDNACRTQSWSYTADDDKDRKGHVDQVLASIRPARICGDARHTYLQMPSSPVAVSDLPVVFEAGPNGESQANYRYAERDRIFTIDSSADVDLKIGSGKGARTMHIRRVGAHG